MKMWNFSTVKNPVVKSKLKHQIDQSICIYIANSPNNSLTDLFFSIIFFKTYNIAVRLFCHCIKKCLLFSLLLHYDSLFFF